MAFHALYSDMCRKHTPIDTLLQLKMNENILRNEKCKVTFGFEYIWVEQNFCALVLNL